MDFNELDVEERIKSHNERIQDALLSFLSRLSEAEQVNTFQGKCIRIADLKEAIKSFRKELGVK